MPHRIFSYNQSCTRWFENRNGLLMRKSRIHLQLGKSVRPEIRASADQLLWSGAAKRRAERAAMGVDDFEGMLTASNSSLDSGKGTCQVHSTCLDMLYFDTMRHAYAPRDACQVRFSWSLARASLLLSGCGETRRRPTRVRREATSLCHNPTHHPFCFCLRG